MMQYKIHEGGAMNKSFRKNKGVVTLLTTVVVMVMMTLMVVFATKVGMFDQRMAGNEARYKESFATAEAGLELAIQRFDNQFRAAGTFSLDGTGTGTPMTTIMASSAIATGTNTAGGVAAANTASFGVTITDSGSVLASFPIYNFVSTGTGADGTGVAVVSRQISMRQGLGGKSPDVPIVVAGSVGTGGDFNIVANPNGAGPGVPVSIWTPTPGGDVSMSGSSATCQLEYFDGNNPQCSNPSGSSELLSQGDGTTATAYTTNFPDVLPNDPNFPDDLFQYLFGVVRSNWQVVKNLAASHGQVVANCDLLNATSGQEYIVWWVTGDCNMGSTQIIGSTDKPVILVVDDHEFDMGGGGARLYGLLYVFDNPDDIATPSTDFHGGPAIYGALVSDVGGSAMNGSYSIVYDSELLNNLAGDGNNTSSYDLAYIPGSWRDF